MEIVSLKTLKVNFISICNPSFQEITYHYVSSVYALMKIHVYVEAEYCCRHTLSKTLISLKEKN